MKYHFYWRRKQILSTVAILLFAAIGAFILLLSHAATPNASFEPENGSTSLTPTIDSKASNGKYIQFGSASGSNPSGGCLNAGVVAPCIGSATTGASGWGPTVFDDEFSGSALDTSKWSKSWFNGSSQNNVTTDPANVAVSGGDLILTLKSSTDGASITTNPNDAATTGFQFGSGYYAEARVYFPGSGTTIDNWPAWWTDGQNWPTTGENDIAEGLGTLTSNYHSTSGANNSGTIAGTWAGAFHTYGLDRENGVNKIYWDGQLVRTYNTNDGGALHYLILNVGSGSGPTVTGAAGALKVDYVRVWK